MADPSKILDGLPLKEGQRGGLEIVFNQQLTRLGYNFTSCVIAPSAKMTYSLFYIVLYTFSNPPYYSHIKCGIKLMLQLHCGLLQLFYILLQIRTKSLLSSCIVIAGSDLFILYRKNILIRDAYLSHEEMNDSFLHKI
ncbi:hypothetical protein SUGI_0652950 [Cryptomeria japonica]|nr:hypothetical protein SUGI_0652950 [Cryptomeria japonica]